MNQMLRGVITSGSGRSAAIGGRDIAGKTGTTSDYKDAWFVGYTGGFVAAVWVGKDDNKAMRGVTGGSSPAAIWRGFMEAALPKLAVQPIPNGPPLPEGWVAPDPVGDMIGQVEDPYAQPVEGEPGPAIIDGQSLPTPRPLPNDQPVVRPTSPQPSVKEAPRAEKKADADFF
jgi:penicillin-binding protein 1A